jgi:hypothetical protein
VRFNAGSEAEAVKTVIGAVLGAPYGQAFA